jgi:hypothetical protein
MYVCMYLRSCMCICMYVLMLLDNGVVYEGAVVSAHVEMQYQVCMCICMYICIYILTLLYVYMYVCMYGLMLSDNAVLYEDAVVSAHVEMQYQVCMCICMYVCTYALGSWSFV